MSSRESPAEYRAALRAFAESNVRPRVAALERSGGHPADLVRKLGAEGFYEPCVPDPDRAGPGRLPMDLRYLRILVEELGRTGCFGLTLTVGMHVGVFLPAVARLGTGALRDEVLAGGRRGELIGTVAATESDVAGSDFAGMTTTVDVGDDRVLVDGHKHWITSGAAADYAVVFGRSRPGRHAASFTAVLVPTDREGVRQEPLEMAVMRANAVGRLEFDRVEVGRDHVLGRPGFGFRYFLDHIAVERLTGAAWAVAVAEDHLAEAQRYAQERSIGTETLWDRGAVRHRVARAAVRLALLRALTDDAFAAGHATGQVDQFVSAALKSAVPEAMEDVIGLCVQLRGAHALAAGSPLLQMLNDFRVWGVAGGSTETMLDVVAEAWAGRARDANAGRPPAAGPPQNAGPDHAGPQRAGETSDDRR
jgi:citronellyl-CoA dehydrogenase